MVDKEKKETSQMSIQLSGNRLPIVVLVTAFSTLIASVVYATVWLTKLDDRVLQNYATSAENRQLIEQITNTLHDTQSGIQKNTIIQKEIIRRLTNVEEK